METTNRITVNGTVIGTPDYSHSVGQERFLRGQIRVKRKSGNFDLLPFLVSERLAPDWTLGDKDEVMLIGQIRSYNIFDNKRGKAKLDVVLFVREITHKSSDETFEDDTLNMVEMDGIIARTPVYRETPFGRQICDVLLKVERAFDKEDCVPCIIWGRDAKYVAKKLKAGDTLKLKGRFQSREYCKEYSDGNFEVRTAYEVSTVELI